MLDHTILIIACCTACQAQLYRCGRCCVRHPPDILKAGWLLFTWRPNVRRPKYLPNGFDQLKQSLRQMDDIIKWIGFGQSARTQPIQASCFSTDHACTLFPTSDPPPLPLSIAITPLSAVLRLRLAFPSLETKKTTTLHSFTSPTTLTLLRPDSHPAILFCGRRFQIQLIDEETINNVSTTERKCNLYSTRRIGFIGAVRDPFE